MRSSRRVVFVLAAAALAVAGSALPARAAVIYVRAGESIQAALDRAEPGDTVHVAPGVFRENVQITTDDVDLVGSGPTEDGTVLEPPEEPRLTPCSFGDPEFTSGVCVAGSPEDPVADVHVSGFLVRGFAFSGLLSFGTQDVWFDHNTAIENGGYGVASFAASGGRHTANVTFDNGEAGLYLGDSPAANFEISGNRTYNNGFGIFVRDASFGTVTNNSAFANCMGLFFLNTGEGAGNSDWEITENQALRNNRFCPGNEFSPPISGTGILLLGSDNNHVAENHVYRNRPNTPTPSAGGIVLMAAGPEGTPDGNTVEGNSLQRNRRADIAWDRSGVGNTFVANDCRTSKPDGLCSP